MRTDLNPTSSVVDIAAIERLIDARPKGRGRQILGAVVSAFSISVAPTIVVPLVGGEGWQGVTSYARAHPWLSFGIPLMLCAFLAAASVVIQSRPAARDAVRIARRVERDWRSLTQGPWIARVLLTGIAMGCLVGIPIGTLLATDARPSELQEGGGRVGIVLTFLGMTLLWTLPAAFLIRFMMLRSYRPLLRTDREASR